MAIIKRNTSQSHSKIELTTGMKRDVRKEKRKSLGKRRRGRWDTVRDQTSCFKATSKPKISSPRVTAS